MALLLTLFSEGQMNDYKGVTLMFDTLPPAKALLDDRGYDADWFRNALIEWVSPPASHQNQSQNAYTA